MASDIIYLKALDQPIVVLNSFEDVVALLEKKSAANSSRAQLPAHDIMEASWAFTFTTYGPQWRARRRAFHQYLNQGRIPDYHPIIQQETATFLRALLEQPDDFMAEMRSLFSHIIMRIAYGAKDFEYNNQIIRDAEAIVDRLLVSMTPGRFLVNVIPALKWVPAWFPGAGWKRFLLEGLELTERALETPFRDASERLGSEGTHDETPSIVQGLVNRLPPKDDPTYPEMERMAKDVSATAYAAGSDTTVSSAHALILALAMHPDVQRKIKEEIDSIVDTTKQLPSFGDLKEMHYLQAVTKEVNRWYNVLPLAVPHLSMEDQEYKGYFFPKGTAFQPNTWAILHDPNVFESPYEFNPERYLKNGRLDTTLLDPDLAAFGYGRRICPGRHLSHDSLLYMAATVLSVFDIRAPKDGEPLKLEATPETMSKIVPFKCEITPRSEKHTALLQLPICHRPMTSPHAPPTDLQTVVDSEVKYTLLLPITSKLLISLDPGIQGMALPDHDTRVAWIGPSYPLDLSTLPVESEEIPIQYPSLKLGYSATPTLTLEQRLKIGDAVESKLKNEKEAAPAPPRE
ncbi:DOPA-dioxygenase [Coprinopsis cinerea okayama7|uniref:DOPA-dioxygenase n=1 Tax=Coprinopsis cinerea (strain Okayama-7 / 130 / ATCC MYA-4618 / FGSC 9003) TaxID=240176 RepID=A8PA20_COPC7|nr:DOPA-dioxygenase [Coprinopsis cinerea okayama7\|eukprot:XP_001839883.2 DOPA-dioxygenase [Coprinopsis cinerea okayama7\